MTSNYNYKHLFDIDSPDDLKKIPLSELQVVCDEVREYLIDVITQVGGHFGAGLGVVELTVALHYVFDTPNDKLIFDTGHQGYPHKILTGRRDSLPTIRQKDGISGFLKRAESIYDEYGAGHASTSISAALGIATARDFLKEDYKVVSITGDGAMTGGLAFEAMNNCGVQMRDITVILNDNNISIAKNVSALSNYFNEIFASSTVQKIRDNIWDITGKLDHLGDRLRRIASRLEDGVKAIVTPGVLFEALGFKYFGPINGHNIHKLVKILRLIKDIHGPILLHVITQKGKGYIHAENDSQRLHAIGKIDKLTGKSLMKNNKNKAIPKYQDVFGEAMVELCRLDNRIVGITAAMPDGTGIDIFEKHFPDRVFDVGIAEAHAVTYAAGIASQGMLPVAAIYSTFLQRAFDQIIHDVALQKLHVVFALDRAGLAGADGPTHHGVFDLAYLRIIPNMTIMAPKDEQELRDMLYSAVFHFNNGAVAIRYPRGEGLGVQLAKMKLIEYGKSETIRNGNDIAILAVGNMVHQSYLAANILEDSGISAEVINARFIKPLDYELIDNLCVRFDKIITVEDGQKAGGFGSAVLEYINSKKLKNVELYLMGIPDNFIEHGTQSELLRELGLDAKGIANEAISALSSNGYYLDEVLVEKNK